MRRTIFAALEHPSMILHLTSPMAAGVTSFYIRFSRHHRLPLRALASRRVLHPADTTAKSDVPEILAAGA